MEDILLEVKIPPTPIIHPTRAAVPAALPASPPRWAAVAILSNGGQLLGDEYRLLRGVGPGFADLRDDADTMSALLIMQSEAGDDDAVDHFVWVDEPATRALLRLR